MKGTRHCSPHSATFWRVASFGLLILTLVPAPTFAEEPTFENPVLKYVEESSSEEVSESSVTTSSVTDPQQQFSPFMRDARLPAMRELDTTSSGSFIYDYPIEIPPGRLGVEPDLTLTYSSHNSDEGAFGYGWDISIPYIERVNYQGIEDLYSTSTPRFTSSLSGELATTTTAGAYVARNDDGSYLRYTLQSNVWTAVDKMGNTYTFGTTTGSRQYDVGNSSKIYRWMLEEIRDTNGNRVVYSYVKDSNQIYPNNISYTATSTATGPFSVSFTRVLRTTPTATTTSAGFPVQTRYQISEITASVDGQWVRKYALTYIPGHNTKRLLLNKVTKSGRDLILGQLSLPATTFTYSTPGMDWLSASFNDWEIPFKFVSDWRDYGGAIADIDGNGLSDIIRAEEDEDGSPSIDRIYARLFEEDWTDLGSSYDDLPCPLTVYDEDDADVQFDAGTRVLDVNGDHLVDFLCNDEDAYLNSGNELNRWVVGNQWVSPISIIGSGLDHDRDRGIRFMDLNGDSLIDIVRGALIASTEVFDAYLNTGNGWQQSTAWDTALHNLDVVFSSSDLPDTGARILDFNGDGLDDIIAGGYDNDYGDENYAYANTGSGWVRAPGWDAPELIDSAYTRVVDFNSDGLPDLVNAEERTGLDDEEDIYLNTGTGWYNDNSIDSPADFSVDGQDAGTRIGEFNGDGIIDFVTYGSGTGWTEEAVNLSMGLPSDLLINVKDSYGATTSLSYKGSASYWPSETGGGNTMPLNVMTVDAITRDSGINTETETYAYAGGSYYYANAFDRLFAGFGKIVRRDAEENETRTFFHQGNTTATSSGEFLDKRSKIGKPYLVNKYDELENLYSTDVTKWEDLAVPGSTIAKFILPTRQTELDYDGDAGSKDRAKNFTYDTYANVKYLQDWGEVNANDDGSFTDVGADLLHNRFAYATSSGNKILGLVSMASTTNQSAQRISETQNYYDNLALGTAVKGLLTKESRWTEGVNFASTTRVFNTFGLPTTETDPRGNSTLFTYDPHTLYVATSTNALGQKDVYTYDYSSGKLLTHKERNGLTFKTTYDALDRLTGEQVPNPSSPSTQITKYTLVYNLTGLPIVTRTDYLDSTNSALTYTYYDRFLRPIQVRAEAETANQFMVSDTVYNSRGLVASESLPYFSTGSARTTPTANAALLSVHTYDSLGRIANTVTADGTTTYANNDWSILTIDPLLNERTHTHDSRGNLAGVKLVNGGVAYQTSYSWDGLGNLLKIVDSEANVRNFVYDGLSRLKSAQDLHAASDPTFGTWTYTYDNAGNRTQSVNPRGLTIVYGYDALNRIITETEGGGSPDITYGYDSSVNYGKGRLTGVSMVGMGAAFDYDQAGNLYAEQKVIPGAATTTTYYFHDIQGNQTSVYYPDGSQTYNWYNTAGLLESVQLLENGTTTWATIVAAINYAPTMAPSYFQYGNSSVIQNTYDPANRYRLSQKISYGPNEYFQYVTYTYDDVGNITQLADVSTRNALNAAFAYDDLYRLEAAVTGSPTVSPGYSQTFTYNSIGNIVNSAGDTYVYAGTGSGNYANPHAPTSIDGVTQTYDKAGNLLDDGPTDYTYNYRDELTQTVGSATQSYLYDHAGQRIRRTGTTTSYYPNRYYSIQNTRPHKNIYAGGQLVATVETVGTTDILRYIYPDHLGSTNAVASSSGALIEATGYFPYGSVRYDNASTTYAQPHKYLGEQYDPASKLSYLNARYYDGARGQFTSQDPVFSAIGDSARMQREIGVAQDLVLQDPQLLNSYSYARNNPLTLNDPEGKIAFLPLLGYVYATYSAAQLSVGAYDVYNANVRYADIYTQQEKNQTNLNFTFDAALTATGYKLGKDYGEAAGVTFDTLTATLDTMDVYLGEQIYKNSNGNRNPVQQNSFNPYTKIPASNSQTNFLRQSSQYSIISQGSTGSYNQLIEDLNSLVSSLKSYMSGLSTSMD